jgi:hypothetical protein
MTRLEWEHFCNWQYDTNQSLACFLSGTQPDVGHWYEPSWLWLGPVLFLALGMFLEWKNGRAK